MEQPQDVLKQLIFDKFITIIEDAIKEANELGLDGNVITDVIIEESAEGEYNIFLEYEDAPESE